MSSPLIDEQALREGLEYLRERDTALAGVLERFGPPPLWTREPGFATLVHVILEQQVSLASARAAFERLEAAIPLTPAHFLSLDDATLRAIGFSRQKTLYVRHLAQAVLDGFDLDGLAELDDLEVRRRLTALKGVGAWTSEVYLLMALRRPDAWPAGDLGLQLAVQELKGLGRRPSPAELEALAEPWRPWRAVAARLAWHHYLSTRC